MPVQHFHEPPIARQLRFLIRIVKLIPTLIASLEAGHVEAGQKVGSRRLRDGRTVELWLVAKAPKRDDRPMGCPPTVDAPDAG
jgi:hypothetical protein